MMPKLKEAFPFRSVFLLSLSQNYHPPSNSPLSRITSSWTFSHNRASSSTPNLNAKNSFLADYLIHHLKFSNDRALSVFNRYPRSRIISPEKLEKVVSFFKDLGFSDAHIQCVVCGAPQVLFADVEHTLKPKVCACQIGSKYTIFGELWSCWFSVAFYVVDEVASMFRKSLYTFGLSEGVLRYKIDFFLRDLKLNKSVLVQHPVFLGCNIEERILPRYKVFGMLKSKRLLKEGIAFSSVAFRTNQQFMEKYILRYENDAEELLLAYNGKLLHASEK